MIKIIALYSPLLLVMGFVTYFAADKYPMTYENKSSFIDCYTNLKEGDSFSLVTHSINDCKNISGS